MMRLITLAVALALSGCAATATKMPDMVEVPIPTACSVALPDPPDFAVNAVPTGAGIYVQMTALLAEREQRIGYERELVAVVQGCTTPP